MDRFMDRNWRWLMRMRMGYRGEGVRKREGWRMVWGEGGLGGVGVGDGLRVREDEQGV